MLLTPDALNAALDALAHGASGDPFAILGPHVVHGGGTSRLVIVTIQPSAARVEVVRFGLGATRNTIEVLATDAGCSGDITQRLRSDGQPFVTDSGNFILDCAFGSIPDPEALDEALKLIPGVVENGLFLGIADAAIIAGPGGVTILERDDPAETD